MGVVEDLNALLYQQLRNSYSCKKHIVSSALQAPGTPDQTDACFVVGTAWVRWVGGWVQCLWFRVVCWV